MPNHGDVGKGDEGNELIVCIDFFAAAHECRLKKN
jgi:hypothetical protein